MRHTAAVETELMAELLGLVEFMATDQDGDGMPREPGLVILSTKGAAWICEVVDRATGLGFATMHLNLDDAVEMANTLLRTGNAPWSKLKQRVNPGT